MHLFLFVRSNKTVNQFIAINFSYCMFPYNANIKSLLIAPINYVKPCTSMTQLEATIVPSQFSTYGIFHSVITSKIAPIFKISYE